MAAMVVLERLSPAQRVAFVLHDALDLPFAAIADVLGCTEATARQHAARARRVVADADAAAARHRGRAAGCAGPVRRRDGPRRPGRAGRRCCTRTRCWSTTATAGCRRRGGEVVGADKVARLLLGLMARYGADAMLDIRPVLVNGEPGMFVPGRGRHARLGPVYALRDDRIVALTACSTPRSWRPRQASANPWSVMPSAWLNRARCSPARSRG